MIELPEAVTIAEQVGTALTGKRIKSVTANHSPHKFAWFYGDPGEYDSLLRGQTVENGISWGGLVEIWVGPAWILFGDGVNLRYHPAGEKAPAKHQLLIEFDDSSSLSGSVQMYGGLWAFPAGQFDNRYYLVAQQRPSPLTDTFDYPYFESLLAGQKVQSLSAKAFLATEQRIPGLGNGVLQDILWTARIHPKRKVATLSDEEVHALFSSVKSVLTQMAEEGGRDTERDLYGCLGGYKTILSRKTAGKPCPACGSANLRASCPARLTRLDLQVARESMEFDCALVLNHDGVFRIPAGREHRASVGDVAKWRRLLIKAIHYGCLKPFKDPWLGSYICSKDAKPFKLIHGSLKDTFPPRFEVSSLFWGPSPSMPDLFSNPLLHCGDV